MMDLKFVECTKCGGDQFLQLMMFAKVPAVMSQTGQEGISPAPGKVVCGECGADLIDQLEEEKEEESNIILAN
jgi:hypothetical protein